MELIRVLNEKIDKLLSDYAKLENEKLALENELRKVQRENSELQGNNQNMIDQIHKILEAAKEKSDE